MRQLTVGLFCKLVHLLLTQTSIAINTRVGIRSRLLSLLLLVPRSAAVSTSHCAAAAAAAAATADVTQFSLSELSELKTNSAGERYRYRTTASFEAMNFPRKYTRSNSILKHLTL